MSNVECRALLSIQWTNYVRCSDKWKRKSESRISLNVPLRSSSTGKLRIRDRSREISWGVTVRKYSLRSHRSIKTRFQHRWWGDTSIRQGCARFRSRLEFRFLPRAVCAYLVKFFSLAFTLYSLCLSLRDISSRLMLDFCTMSFTPPFIPPFISSTLSACAFLVTLSTLDRYWVKGWRALSDFSSLRNYIATIASLVLRFSNQINVINAVKVHQGRPYRASGFDASAFSARQVRSRIRDCSGTRSHLFNDACLAKASGKRESENWLRAWSKLDQTAIDAITRRRKEKRKQIPSLLQRKPLRSKTRLENVRV